MNKLWFILRSKILRNPFAKKTLADKAVTEEYKNSKKHRYATFEEFLRDCPEYQIDGSFLGSIVRSIRESAGAKFQQWVFIDEGSPIDTTCWIRREKDLLIHEKGTYFMPWVSGKKIEYRDIHDSRPLIDRTHEMDWTNPDMCADVVTAVTNSRNMNDLRGMIDPRQNYLLYVLIISVIVLGLTAFSWYTNSTANQHSIEILNRIADQIANQTKIITVK